MEASCCGISLLPIPVIGSIARGTQRLSCSTHAPWSRALNNSAVECRVLWNQLPEFVKDWRGLAGLRVLAAAVPRHLLSAELAVRLHYGLAAVDAHGRVAALPGLRKHTSFFARTSAPLSCSRGEQAALKCSYRGDSVTRDWPVALRVRAAKRAGRERKKGFWLDGPCGTPSQCSSGGATPAQQREHGLSRQVRSRRHGLAQRFERTGFRGQTRGLQWLKKARLLLPALGPTWFPWSNVGQTCVQGLRDGTSKRVYDMIYGRARRALEPLVEQRKVLGEDPAQVPGPRRSALTIES